ncbi:hypothetical protein MMIN_12870 [Mycolicibacter minnesotensis]|nr:DUF6779 domain-containing protein [Mycolicibacter minnesotensis]BBY33226.1 hypothetical protein MMIN_12870 [Mycolicibacter minnesotensis]
MTTLLILAIAASSALVFTSRVELLKLAVIIALWAAVAAAFVSVIYRRQSDVDQARARDLKLVYDLQLDREISARREYELTVESQLRRELASELRAQAADEVAALRTELAALRTNLEILFDADLSHRPALETERTTVRAYSDWARSGGETASGAARVASVAPPNFPPDSVTQTAENPIIDVPEVRIPAVGNVAPAPPAQPPFPEGRRGSHRRRAEEPPSRVADEPASPPASAGRWAQPPQPFIAPEPRPEARREPEPPPPPEHPQPPRTAMPGTPWTPVGAEGEWLPPGAPGSNWSADAAVETGRHGAPEQSVEPPSRHGRHSGATEPVAAALDGAESTRHDGGGRRARSRHSVEPAPAVSPAAAEPQVAEPVVPAHAAAPASRHSATSEGSADSPGTGGQSVADLLARLQPSSGAGGRRRRRED